jgi:hypothetical protein
MTFCRDIRSKNEFDSFGYELYVSKEELGISDIARPPGT